MGQEYLEIANNDFGFWVIGVLMVSIVVFQSILFMKKAWVTGQEMGIEVDRLKSGLRSALITSIGPAFAVLIGMVALIVLIGAPLAWMRLSVIGAVMYEGYAAEMGAQALGTTVGGEGYGLLGFANSLWVISLGCCGWLLIAGLFTHKLDDLRIRVVGKRQDLMPVISVAAILGAFGFQVSKALVVLGRPTISAIAAMLTMVLIQLVATKTGKIWMKEWSMGIAMVSGMFFAVIL